MDVVGIFYGHVAYFTSIWYILWPFGIFYGHLVYFSHFGLLYQEQSGSPDGVRKKLSDDHLAFFIGRKINRVQWKSFLCSRLN
jgi:hypothetical protein